MELPGSSDRRAVLADPTGIPLSVVIRRGNPSKVLLASSACQA
jgi:hypothetical protein